MSAKKKKTSSPVKKATIVKRPAAKSTTPSREKTEQRPEAPVKSEHKDHAKTPVSTKAIPSERILTAEGWKRMMIRERKTPKK